MTTGTILMRKGVETTEATLILPRAAEVGIRVCVIVDREAPILKSHSVSKT